MKKWTVLLLTIAFASLIFWSCSDDGGGTTEPINKAPTCTITSPAPDSIIDEGSLINVTVNADDTDGEISKVYYSINDNLVDSAVASPYSKNISTQGLLLGQYYIIVTAKDNDNKYSDPDSVFFSISPKAPSNISISQESITTAGISWNDNSYGEDKFVLERKTASETEYNVIAEISGSDTSTKSYADESLVPGTTYNYRIKSVKDTFESNYLMKDYDNIFSPPSDLSIKQSNVYTFRLNWKSNSVGEDGFKIERSIDESDYTEIASVTDTIYVDDSVSKGYTTVNYRVRAYKGDIYTDYVSDNSSVSFPEPTNFVYTKETLSAIRLNWADNSYGEEGFKIDKKVGIQDWISSFAIAGENITTWTDTNAEINENLQYRIYGYKGLNFTESVSTEIIDNTIPAPTALTIVQNNVHTFTLNWTDNSLGEDGFRIERKIDEGEFTEIATVTETNYVDDTVAKKGYGIVYYQIRAYKGTYNSAYAAANSEVSFPAPTNITATQLSLTSVNLTWDDNSIGEEIFEIERKLSTESTYIKIGEVVGNDNSTKNWTDTTIELGPTYDYRIRAVKGSNSSAYEIKTAYETLPAPTNLSYSTISSTTLDLDWTYNMTGEDGFRIDRMIGTSGTWLDNYGLVGAGVTTWTDSNYCAFETCFYRVRAYYSTYNSDYSNIVETLPIVEDMIYIPSGNFQMGQEGLLVHSVTLSNDYYIKKYEVTNQEYCDMLNYAKSKGQVTAGTYAVSNKYGDSQNLIDMGEVDCQISYNGMSFDVEIGMENRPVIEVTWYGSAFFCNMLSKKYGLSELYNLSDWSCNYYGTSGFRLPTEAEWEYAARYNDGRTYPWGEVITKDHANYYYSGIGHTSDVGSFSPLGDSQLGLCDMAGNVFEWCNDWYAFYTGDETDPTGPSTGTYRVSRGGYWNGGTDYCKSAFRNGSDVPSSSGNSIGFRFVGLP